MKTFLCFLGLTLAGVAAPATASKAKTYFVAGYFDGRQPTAELVQQAAVAVGEKMDGCVQVQDKEEADHVIEILFRHGSYQVFVDALPLEHKGDRFVMQHSLHELTVQADMARDAADGHGRNGSVR
jgi:hypothetical protein